MWWTLCSAAAWSRWRGLSQHEGQRLRQSAQRQGCWRRMGLHLPQTLRSSSHGCGSSAASAQSLSPTTEKAQNQQLSYSGLPVCRVVRRCQAAEQPMTGTQSLFIKASACCQFCSARLQLPVTQRWEHSIPAGVPCCGGQRWVPEVCATS